MKITVEQDKCVAAGQCAATAPDVFDVGVPPLERSREWGRDEDGVVVLLTDDPPAELADDARDAAAVCPALAIRIAQ